jgi:hypothetical protein
MWHDLLTDKEVRDIFLHALVILMSFVSLCGFIIWALFSVCRWAYARWRDAKQEGGRY